jgi:hypothetical protein
MRGYVRMHVRGGTDARRRTLAAGRDGEGGCGEAHPSIVASPEAAGITRAEARGEKGAMGREDLSRFMVASDAGLKTPRRRGDREMELG